MTIVAAHATAERLNALRNLTPFAENDPVTQLPAGQQQVGDYLITATDGGTSGIADTDTERGGDRP